MQCRREKREKDPSYQNAVEFLAVVVSLLVLARLGFRNISVRFAGDSVSSLAWATTRAFRRGRSFRSACALTEICLRLNLAIDPDYIHIPGEVHYDEDLISRGGSTGKGRACDLMQRSNLVNFWRELGELVDDSVTLFFFGFFFSGLFSKQPVCVLIKSGDLQFFVSALISQL